MKAVKRRVSTCLGMLTLAIFTGPSFAGQIAIEPGAGNAASLLIDTANRPVDAMYLLLEVNHRDALTGGNSTFFNGLRSRLQKATVARIEYTYTVGDVATTRVYHAASGRPNEAIFKGVESSKGASSGTESTGAGSTDDNATRDFLADWEQDVAESKFYPPDTATDVRAPAVRYDDQSALTHFDAEGRPRGADAEFKAFRKIEDDILGNIIPRGGRVTGYVSKAVCDSCRKVIDDFAATYDAEGTVYELLEPRAGGAATAGGIRGQSQEASRDLLNNRKTFLKSRIQKTTAVKAATGHQVHDIEAREASLRQDDADGC